MTETITNVLDNTLTAGQLIDMLKGHDRNTPVLCTVDYGDRGHTEQALPFSDIEEYTSAQLGTTGYSKSGVRFITDDEDDNEHDESTRSILLIRL